MKQRLDILMAKLGIVPSRSQAESWIKLGKVLVDGTAASKPGVFVNENSKIELVAETQYVGRAGLKLESVASVMGLDFTDKVVLDVGSSTGGFTDYSLRNGAKKVIAVDVGTDQMHFSLLGDERVELHEKTDIRDFYLTDKPDIVLIDVSFISLREILPHIAKNLSDKSTQIVAMVKPQFEAGRNAKFSGVIKNDAMRRQILRDFEDWSKKYFVISNKRDSEIKGSRGNQERFYILKTISKR